MLVHASYIIGYKVFRGEAVRREPSQEVQKSACGNEIVLILPVLLIKMLLIQIMKSSRANFDTDSHSTQPRQRKFSRRSKSKSPQPRSRQNSDTSLTKFWVRQLSVPYSTVDLHQTLCKDIIIAPVDNNVPEIMKSPRVERSIQRHAGQKQHRQNNCSEIIASLQNEVRKYQAYVGKHREHCQELQNRNKNLEQEIRNLSLAIRDQIIQNSGLRLQVLELKKIRNNRQTCQCAVQNNQSSMKKLKSTILNERLIQCQNQKEKLIKTIELLELKIVEERRNSLISLNCKPMTPDMLASKNKRKLSEQTEAKIKSYDTVARELLECREEVKKLKLNQNHLQRKFFTEMEYLRTQKQKQYEELKKKFTEFLQKYKANMKRYASLHVEKFKASKNKLHVDMNVSFSLSSDQEVQI